MRVARLNLDGFMHHRAFELALPPTGVVLVTGPNGAGKSALPEAIAECVWGESLRGARWRESYALALELEDGATVARRAKGKDRLTTSLGTFDTSMKAQESIDAAFGSFDVWRRSHVFSSADVAHFTLATDAARKDLLETLLGLARFEAAEKRAGLAHAEVSAVHVANTAALASARRTYAQAKATFDALRVDLVESPPGPAPDIAAAQARVSEIQNVLLVAQSERNAGVALLCPDLVGAERCLAEAERALELARKRELAASKGECYACGQRLSEHPRSAGQDTLESLESSVASARDELEIVRLAAVDYEADARRRAVDRASVDAAMRSHQLDLNAALREFRAVSDAATAYAVRVVEARAYAAKLSDARDRWIAETDRVEAAEDAALVTKDELDVLAMCRDALGLRGARVHVLSDALRGVEGVANYWLDRLYDGAVRCRLDLGDDSREKGQRAGSIALTFEGLGDGGYKSLSTGQRRRVDVAMLLALAEIGSLASGRAPGTLWVDEAFDSLDDAGVAAVQSALSDIAADRCVVVITHSEAVASGMRAAQRVRVGGA